MNSSRIWARPGERGFISDSDSAGLPPAGPGRRGPAGPGSSHWQLNLMIAVPFRVRRGVAVASAPANVVIVNLPLRNRAVTT